MVYNYPYHRNYFNNNFYSNTDFTNENDLKETGENLSKKENTSLENTTENIIDKNNDRCSTDDTIINILGIKLSFDDLLILGLLYILYSEGNKDISLYIVLILLLMS